jgi:hypothetical protein
LCADDRLQLTDEKKMRKEEDKEGYLKTDRQTLEHPISGLDFPGNAQPLYTSNDQIVLVYARRSKAKERNQKH